MATVRTAGERVVEALSLSYAEVRLRIWQDRSTSASAGGILATADLTPEQAEQLIVALSDAVAEARRTRREGRCNHTWALEDPSPEDVRSMATHRCSDWPNHEGQHRCACGEQA